MTFSLLKNTSAFFFLFCFLISIPNSNLNALSVTQIGSNYAEFCQRAANNEQLFLKFRENASVRAIVDTLNYEEGLLMLNTIKRLYPSLLSHLEKICIDDQFGAPYRCYYSPFGYICPTTLRYLKIAGELQKQFEDMKNLKIIEIGGGYGGQCKILSETVGFNSYTIVDLPEVAHLTQKYLSHFQVPHVKCMHNKQLHETQFCDLLISNYAFSEVDKEEQLLYIEKIISHASRGYITYNDVSHHNGISSLSLKEVINILSREDRNITIEPENPLTGDNNYVIVWRPKKN